MKIKGGPHLGVVRNWIQCKARNGESVIWGSNTIALSAFQMDMLAQDIANAVFDQIKRKLRVCDDFEHDFLCDKIGYCKNCGHHEDLHKKDFGI